MGKMSVCQNRISARTLPTTEYHALGFLVNVALLKMSTPAFNASTKLSFCKPDEGTVTAPDII